VKLKVLIKASNLEKKLSFDPQRCAACPQDLFPTVVLAQVSLKGLEDPPPAKGIPVAIEEATRRSRVLKASLILVR